MTTPDVQSWLDKNTVPGSVLYLKRLAGNDTLATGAHQAGPYIPKEVLFSLFPAINQVDTENPDQWFDLSVDSHGGVVRRVRAVWYNNKYRGGTRDEARMTNFGGGSSALLDPENTGAIAIFAFLRSVSGNTAECRVWVCRNEFEEDIAESFVGPVEPGYPRTWTVDTGKWFGDIELPRRSCWLEPHEIPAEWLVRFPTGEEIVEKALVLRSVDDRPVDERLMKRRDCEFEVFRSIEQAVELPSIRQGFGTLDEFIAKAQSILQRRKSRAGRSLELHTRRILIEEGLLEGRDFSYQPESEDGKKPDFLFPSHESYSDPQFPPSQLRVLGVKTTCKDRWRQVLSEADRIRTKHVLTLQEGVSERQFQEMQTAGVRLVVPETLHDRYPTSVRSHLMSLKGFIQEVRTLQP
ncbi:MAG: type II restriction endonuclease [Candidatus Sumerlaeia bacterium]|nr:type II restriction endonuclease [Candidatus Sumerlaeia bacterium]